MRRRSPLVVLLLALLLPRPSIAQHPFPLRDRLESERCTPAARAVSQVSSTEWLERARTATGLAVASDRVVHWRATETDVQAYQSDRPYPPYIQGTAVRNWWFDPSSGVERWQPVASNGGAVLRTAKAAFMLRDSIPRPVPPLFAFHESSRALNPLAVLVDFGKTNVRVTETCTFRDFPRVVLTDGDARLYLDIKTAMPVKFERVEKHDIWGQRRAEYVYATWWRSGRVALPIVSVRYVDGVEELRRDLSLPHTPNDEVVADLARTDAPPLAAPAGDHRASLGSRMPPVPVDTIRVAADLYLLHTPYYTHAVTQQGDTAYLFDATSGEWRSRADSAWIARLFPRAKATVLVVSDLAWPHVAGVRFWAARGATIVSHAISRPFLEQLLDRRWLLAPDALDQARASKHTALTYRLVTHGGAFALASGAIRVNAIDGIGSEGALYAWLPAQGFLWAGDYIQDVTRPSQYAIEVRAAMRRDGIAPQRVAAQHLPLTAWTTVEQANPER